MGPHCCFAALEGGGLIGAYGRLASLLANQTPERLAAFWESLPTMGRKQTNQPEPESFADIIKARIRSLDISAYAVAKRSGVNSVVVQRFLNGERGINLATANKLCRELDLVLVARPDSALSSELHA